MVCAGVCFSHASFLQSILLQELTLIHLSLQMPKMACLLSVPVTVSVGRYRERERRQEGERAEERERIRRGGGRREGRGGEVGRQRRGRGTAGRWHVCRTVQHTAQCLKASSARQARKGLQPRHGISS